MKSESVLQTVAAQGEGTPVDGDEGDCCDGAPEVAEKAVGDYENGNHQCARQYVGNGRGLKAQTFVDADGTLSPEL